MLKFIEKQRHRKGAGQVNEEDYEEAFGFKEDDEIEMFGSGDKKGKSPKIISGETQLPQ